MLPRLPRRFAKAIAAVRSAGFPWTAKAGAGTPEAARAVRRSARTHLADPFPRPLRPLARASMILAWPIQSFVDAWTMSGTASFPGRRRLSLAWSAWRTALRHNIAPLEYLAYRMPDRPEVPPDAWAIRQEIVRLNAALADPAVARLASDKHDFWLFCRERGLPAIPTLLLIDSPASAGPPAERDLVLKPRSAANARQIEHWRAERGAYRRLYPEPASGEPLSWRDFLSHADAARRSGGTMLLQPMLVLHPALSAVVHGGSPAARIVTGLWADGRLELLYANFARPSAGYMISNGGARRAIEFETGRLLPPEPGRRRPVFGGIDLAEELDGVVLPDWERARQLVLDAHRAMPGRAVLLGWDVAFTERGPVLIEVNLGISCFLQQMDSLEPASRVTEVLASWLA